MTANNLKFMSRPILYTGIAVLHLQFLRFLAYNSSKTIALPEQIVCQYCLFITIESRT